VLTGFCVKRGAGVLCTYIHQHAACYNLKSLRSALTGFYPRLNTEYLIDGLSKFQAHVYNTTDM
jgi:hypothetical protein